MAERVGMPSIGLQGSAEELKVKRDPCPVHRCGRDCNEGGDEAIVVLHVWWISG